MGHGDLPVISSEFQSISTLVEIENRYKMNWEMCHCLAVFLWWQGGNGAGAQTLCY